MEKDENNNLKDRTVCKSCYNKNRKNNDNTLIQHQQTTIDIVNNVINNRTFIIGFSNCGKTYPVNYILLQKQEPIVIITKSVNKYPNVKAQTSEEIQPLEKFENSTVVFDDLLLSKQKAIFICFLQAGVKSILIFTIHLKAIFDCQKNFS